jgi:hypothetical protein
MTLTKDFIKKIPRENSGSNTSNAYDFQKNWSLWLLLDCHERMQDYLIVFDYHDDVVVLDSETSASLADFYQVKTTRERAWTFAKLIRRKKDESLSFIGKMYENKAKFKCNTNSVNFISNAQFDFELCNEEDGESRDIIHASELSDTLKTKLREALKMEHGISDVEFEAILFFKVSELSLRSHADEVLGKLTRFLEKRYPDQKLKSVPFYKALFEDISRKTNYGKVVSEYAESLKRKSLSRSEFEQQLNSITIKKDFGELWRSIEPVLRAEGMNPVQTRNLQEAWESLEIHLMDRTDVELQSIFSFAKETATNLRKTRLDLKTLTAIIDQAIVEIAKDNKKLSERFTPDYIKCIIMAAFYE